MSHSTQIHRLRFLKMALAGIVFAPGLAVLGKGLDQLRGDRVGWARLKTPSPSWMRHAGSDPVLMKFFREETTLNIDPIWYAADANDLAELCKYPFLFSQGVGVITDPVGRSNLAEYFRRGGFLLVDACHDIHVTPDFDEFFRSKPSSSLRRCPRRGWCRCRRRMIFTAATSRFPTGDRRIRSWGTSMMRARRGTGFTA